MSVSVFKKQRSHRTESLMKNPKPCIESCEIKMSLHKTVLSMNVSKLELDDVWREGVWEAILFF